MKAICGDKTDPYMLFKMFLSSTFLFINWFSTKRKGKKKYFYLFSKTFHFVIILVHVYLISISAFYTFGHWNPSRFLSLKFTLF